MSEDRTCSSCKRRISNIAASTYFMCPGCAKHEIVRCGKCREVAVKYLCPSCGFEGPH